MITRSVVVLLLAALAVAVSAPKARADVRGPVALLEWIAGHPRSAGLAVVRPGEGTILAGASTRTRFPLASTRKVLILGAYARQVAAGRLDPAERVPLAAVERWYWPGTDGGAHPQAMAEWRARGTLVGEGAGATVALDDVARAMIRWSDNAAADWLLDRVGAREVDRFARSQGMRRQDRLFPLLGEFLAWTERNPSSWAALAPGRRAQVASGLASRTTGAEAATRPLPAITAQRRFAAVSPAGTPGEWGRLMARIASGRGLSRAAEAVLRRHLEWALEEPEGAKAYSRLAFKGGSLPGVLTGAYHLRPRGGRPLAVVVFLRDLPPRVERDALASGAVDALVLRLATDPAFLQRARRELDR